MRLLAVIDKEFRQIRRDPRTLFMTIFTPAALLLLFGYALSFDVKNVKTAVLDLDRSEHSRSLIASLSSSGYFIIADALTARHEIDTGLDRGSFLVAVVIPPGFGRTVEAGENAEIQAFIDGSNSQSATIVQGYLKVFFQQYSIKVAAAKLLRAGKGRLELPVSLEPRIWYNPELKSKVFLIPGIMVFILMISSTISTSLSIVREREQGTIEQLLVSPLGNIEIIVGKMIPYVFIGLASASIIIAVSNVVFSVPVRGNYLLLLGATLLFIFSALGQGILISTMTSSLQVAYQVAALSSLLPSLILSGFIFPIKNMAYPLQLLSYAVPARYFVSSLRSILLKGAGLEAYWQDLVSLAVFAFIILAIANIRMRRVRLV